MSSSHAFLKYGPPHPPLHRRLHRSCAALLRLHRRFADLQPARNHPRQQLQAPRLGGHPRPNPQKADPNRPTQKATSARQSRQAVEGHGKTRRRPRAQIPQHASPEDLLPSGLHRPLPLYPHRPLHVLHILRNRALITALLLAGGHRSHRANPSVTPN